MSNDRVTKSLLAVIAGLLGVIAVRSVPLEAPGAAFAQPVAPGPAKPVAEHLQITATSNGFLVLDRETGELLRATTAGGVDGYGMNSLGTLRKTPAGKWELAFTGVAAAAPDAKDKPPADPAAAAAIAQATKAQADLATLVTALGAFRLDTGRYPTTEEGLHSLVVQPSAADNWKGPYVKPTLPMDPWGNPYVYHFPGRADAKRPDLLSFGPDRKEGGGDDLLGLTTAK